MVRWLEAIQNSSKLDDDAALELQDCIDQLMQIAKEKESFDLEEVMRSFE